MTSMLFNRFHSRTACVSAINGGVLSTFTAKVCRLTLLAKSHRKTLTGLFSLHC
jgi:hypothetical protein